jgi:hypothetical protein
VGPELVALSSSAALALRLGREAEGFALLARAVDALLAELAADPRRAATLAPCVERMLAAQRRGDLLFVADLLEHELPGLAR